MIIRVQIQFVLCAFYIAQARSPVAREARDRRARAPLLFGRVLDATPVAAREGRRVRRAARRALARRLDEHHAICAHQEGASASLRFPVPVRVTSSSTYCTLSCSCASRTIRGLSTRSWSREKERRGEEMCTVLCWTCHAISLSRAAALACQLTSTCSCTHVLTANALASAYSV